MEESAEGKGENSKNLVKNSTNAEFEVNKERW